MSQSSSTQSIRSIDFIDLKAQQRLIRKRLDKAIAQVLDHGQYIMGPEVFTLEKQLSEFCGVRHSISCANGTDAIYLVLMAKGVGPGDAVFVPAFTFVAPAEAVALVGATPFFVDVDEDTFLMDPKSLQRCIAAAKKQGLKAKGVIVVDLFGQAANCPHFEEIAKNENLFLLSDAAQSFGASFNGQSVGNLTAITTTSFFPAKPLGCYGDGGAIFTTNDELHQILLSLRIHGQGAHKYENVRIGINGRLDTIQAAILIEKLAIFPNEIAGRNKIAKRYDAALSGLVKLPKIDKGATSIWSQYTIRVPNRDSMQNMLKSKGIPTVIYYPYALHQQKAYTHYPIDPNGLPASERLCNEVLSIPIDAYLDPSVQDYICENIKKIVHGK